MPPLSPHHNVTPVLRRAIRFSDWDPTESRNRLAPRIGAAQPAPRGVAVAGFDGLKSPGLFLGALAPSRQVEVSSVFTNAWKREIYDAWVDLDLLPAFMRGSDDGSEPERFELPWYLKLEDREVRWEARTTECVYADLISWESVDHAVCQNRGSVTFTPEGRGVTRVRVSLCFEGPGNSAVTHLTLKRVEFQLRDTLALLHTFLAPHALPPALAPL